MATRANQCRDRFGACNRVAGALAPVAFGAAAYQALVCLKDVAKRAAMDAAAGFTVGVLPVVVAGVAEEATATLLWKPQRRAAAGAWETKRCSPGVVHEVGLAWVMPFVATHCCFPVVHADSGPAEIVLSSVA